MKAAIFEEHGAPDVIRTAEIPDPEPGPGEVRVRVRASSLNHLDLWARRGDRVSVPLPHVGGSDIAGEVDRLGPGVEGVRTGTRVVVDPTLDWEWVEGVRRGSDLPNPHFRVIGEHTWGGFAQWVVVPTQNLLQLPEHVPWRTAAATSLVGVTAWRGLVSRGALRAGDRVLVTGGSGGVATVAVQIARRAGARVFVLTSGPENCRRLEALGAHVALDRLAGDVKQTVRAATAPRGVDLVLDGVGEPLWGVLFRALAPGGRLVSYGATGGAVAQTDLRYVYWKQLSILGTTMGTPAEFRQAMEMVFQGAVEPVIDSVVGLDGVRDAHRRLEEGGVFGKIVVEPG